jgi:hypothetical protein
MRNVKRKSDESGVALLLAIFTLLLLTAMGLSLLCAADLETSIAANYRDKQVSIYSALSGLQEARDRLIPSRCDPVLYPVSPFTACPDPALDTRSLGVPSTSNNGVLYILNPLSGETVAPWDYTNKYFDNELCHENILGLTAPTPAGSCPVNSTSVPAGTAWYKIYDDSTASGVDYQPVAGGILPKALPYKWVRVTVKTDNMTPALAQNPATGSVMCWDGRHQVPMGTIYNSQCGSNGGLQLTYSNGTPCGGLVCTFNPPVGGGYTNGQSVTITGGGGTGAAATVQTTGPNGELASITVNSHGSNYAAPPTISITGGGAPMSTAATAVPVMSGASVSSITLAPQTAPIGCYALGTTPNISFLSNGFGTGAAATATMTGPTCIAGWTININNGNNKCDQSGTVTVGATGGGGSGFQANIVLGNDQKSISSATITSTGTGYTSAPTGITGLTSCTVSVTYTLGAQLSAVTLNSNPSGSGYAQPPSVSITSPGAGQTPTATATLGPATSGQIDSITLLSPGAGYTSPPTVTITPAAGDSTGGGATATANLVAAGAIKSVTLSSAGTGYTSAPSVSISGGTGAANAVGAKTGGLGLGRVFLLTALAVSPGGSRTMSQMEVATPVHLPVTMPGALTIDAPNLTSTSIQPNNSHPYVISGIDGNTGSIPGCSYPQQPAKTAVGVTDNPNSPPPPGTPTSVACVTSTLGGAPDPSCPQQTNQTTNYIGAQASPDVQNVYSSLGDLTTPTGCNELATKISDPTINSGTIYTYPNNPPCSSQNNCSVHLGTYPSDCPTIVVNGDLNLPAVSGCGILLVTGNLSMQGNYTWDGPVFVIGANGYNGTTSFTGGGGGGGIINGSLFVAQDKNLDGTLRTTLGTPTVSFQITGGGGNGIQYNSCYSDAMLSALNLSMPASNQPLKILSVRNIF